MDELGVDELGVDELGVDELGARDRELDRVLVGGRRAVRVELVAYDPLWPLRFAEHRARIVGALGPVTVEHVGSTAVPGLAAKPIVDVQVALPDPDDEPAYLQVLEAAGYLLRVREPGHRMLTSVAADVNVHVHAAGDPELEDRRRLRDRLRADPAARERYEQVKRSLAQREWSDVNHYADAKGPVIRELLGKPC